MIARRLGAQQILTADPNNTSAKTVLEDCDLKLKKWSDQNKKPGKFTGQIGVNKMDKREIAGAIETWVRKVNLLLFYFRDLKFWFLGFIKSI